MDAINLEVLKQLQEYASAYFNAIVELNSVNGKCNLQPGKYSAKEMAADPCKTFGQYYALPQNNEFNEEITVQSGTFHASFPYRQIFRILNEWENMCRAGKLKAIFEIEGAEEKTAPVLYKNKKVTGEYYTSKIRLQRVAGNWWIQRKISRTKATPVYYELNGIMFDLDKSFWISEIENKSHVKFCESWDDKGIIKLIRAFVSNPSKNNDLRDFYTEILNRAGIELQPREETAVCEESATITRAEKEECAVRYCKIKGVKADIVTDNDEIIAVTPNGCKVRYIGRFRRSGEIVLFDKERELLSIPELPTEEPENPQIPIESAETKEVSAEEEKCEETANYRIFRHSHNDYTKIIVGDRSHSKVIAILLTIGNKSYIEINDESAGLATIGQKPLQTSKPITELTDKDVLELIYESQQPPTEPPQDTGTEGRHDIPPKPKEAVRNAPAAPPEPSKAIHTISGPPGQILTIAPTIDKNSILHNHDRNNYLAPPHLHNRVLRLPRLPGGFGYNIRHLRVWYPCIVAPCQADRQASRGSPHRPREGDRRMGEEMGKETPFT